jgi:hypothetical protein
MRERSAFFAFLGVCLTIVPAAARADDSGRIVGVWLCSVVRAGTVARPIIWTFNNDGTFNFVSGTTVNNTTNPASPTYNSGIFSRPGGGRGEWTHVQGHVFNAKYVELLSNDHGNLAGYFNVDSTVVINDDGQLCTSRAECPDQQTLVSLVKYDFAGGNPDGPIIGQHTLLPTGSPANAICNRISSGLGFPAPMPPLVPAK